MEVNCFISDKEVHLLILLQVQDQFSPLSHHPELSLEWMLKATKRECQFLKAGKGSQEGAQDLAQSSDTDPQEGNNEKGSIAFPAQT